MTIDALAVLSALLRYSGHDVAAHQFASDETLASLVAGGYLTPAGLPDSIPCEVCDETHACAVVNVADAFLGFCRRTGETFSVTGTTTLHRVDGACVARCLAGALTLDGDVRLVPGFQSLWRLGGCRIHATKVLLFFVPHLDQLDLATSVLEAVNSQAMASRAGLIVASETLDHIRLIDGRLAVARMRDFVRIGHDGSVLADHEKLAELVLPDVKPSRSPGAPAMQRSRIIPILDAMEREGQPFDGSNAACKTVRQRYRTLHKSTPPVHDTIRSAAAWRAETRSS